MRTLGSYRKDADYFSSTASSITRQLAFAGIAVVWIFRIEKAGCQQVPEALIPATLFLMLALAVDLLHYVIAWWLWAGFCRIKEWKGSEHDDKFKSPRWMNWPALVFWHLKIAFVAIGYTVLIRYLLQLWHVK